MAEKGRMTIYPSEELKERIESIAAREHRSANAQVLLWLEDIVARESDQLAVAFTGARDEVGDSLRAVVRDGMPTSPTRIRAPRTDTCPHRLAPNQFCKECDV